MFQIQTGRLRLIPLTAEQLALLAQSRATLEHAMQLTASRFELNADDSFLQEFDQVVRNYLIPIVSTNPSRYEWFTQWIIVWRENNLTIGGIGLGGLPDENGEVMLGYFVDRKYEGLGVATEAVKHLVSWAFENNDAVKAVVADTLPEGYASQKVLLKSGFVAAGMAEEGPRWKCYRPQ